MLLDAGSAVEAEQVFGEDLERFPRNGWSLHGLAQALQAQGRAAEADSVEVRVRTVWASADVEPTETEPY